MKIYINNVEVKSEILPLDTPTLDETLETFSFSLISTTIGSAFAPMQSVKFVLENDNNDVINFVLVSDNVDIFAMNPLRYKHSITCTQNTRKLSKHIVRDSVFTQPSYKYKEAFNAGSMYTKNVLNASGADLWDNLERTSPNQASEKLILLDNEKIGKSYIEIDFQYVFGNSFYLPARCEAQATTIQKIETDAPGMDNSHFSSYLLLSYDDANNTPHSTRIYPSDLGLTEWPFNKGKVEFNRIRELANQGANNFELRFPDFYFYDATLTNQISDTVQWWAAQLKIIAETYYYTAYDILNLLDIRYKQINASNERASLFQLPVSGELFDLLTSTIAPNFTFTQLTMYECVADVFRLFDAIFTMDENNVLGIEYFNDANKPTLANPKFTGRNVAIGEDKYTNGLVAYYQDGRTEETFPSNKTFSPLRSTSLGVPEIDDYVFLTPHPIHDIIKVELLISDFNLLPLEYVPSNNLALDITRYVIEESVWTLLDDGNVDDTIRDNRSIIQANTIYYKQGDNKINIAYSIKPSWGTTYYAINELISCALIRLAGIKKTDAKGSQFGAYTLQPKAPTWSQFRMRVTYTTIVDGKTKVESIVDKYNGETIIDQYNGAVDLNKMGLNMLGLSLKLGEPTLNCSHKISKWDNRVKVGDVLNYDNQLWIANVCSYTVLNDEYIQGKISFVKNYNALALRTQLLREKRISNIASELVNKSEDIFVDFVYFASRSSYLSGSTTLNGRIATGLYLSFKDDESIVDYYGNFVGLFRNKATGKYYYIPMIRYGLGNSICFEMSFDSSITAGNKTTYIDSGTPTWFGDDKYYTEATNYTDDGLGFIDQCYLYVRDVPTDYQWTNDFPEVASADLPLGNNVFVIDSYQVKKQPNEIFAFNYELAFIPYSPHEDFIGSEFINNNFFTNGRINKKIYLYYSTDEDFKYSILDAKGEGSIAEITDVSFNSGGPFITLTFTHEDIEEAGTIYSWAICDSDGNILFASNNGSNGTSTTKKLYFAVRHTRLNTKKYTDDGIEIV